MPGTQRRRRAHVWLLAALFTLTACGSAPPAPAPPPHPVTNPEDAATWAVRTLDACALMGAGGEMTTPHSCQLQRGDQYVTVSIGGEITHFARYRSQLEDVHGLRVYGSYDPKPGYGPGCQFGIPLSPTRAVWITAEGVSGSTYQEKCAPARPVLETVAAALRGNPAALATGQGALSRWTACELLQPMGPPHYDDPVGENNAKYTRLQRVGDPLLADDCEWGDYRFGGLRLKFTVGTLPAEGEPFPLGGVTARLYHQANGDDFCTLIWPQDTRKDGKITMGTLQGSQCATVKDAATKIRAKLAGPAPATPVAPGKLGIPTGQRDEPGDPVCVISPLAEPSDGCRAAKPVPIPAGSAAIMRVAATPDGVDLACALLSGAIKAATGKDGFVAYTKEKCLGSTADRSVDFDLAFDTSAQLPEWEGPRYDVGGFPAVAHDVVGLRTINLSDTRGVDHTGRVSLEARPAQPPAVATFESPDDPARLTIADKIATAVMSRF